jgi:hypothetical protein
MGEPDHVALFELRGREKTTRGRDVKESKLSHTIVFGAQDLHRYVGLQTLTKPFDRAAPSQPTEWRSRNSNGSSAWRGAWRTSGPKVITCPSLDYSVRLRLLLAINDNR